MVKNQNSNEEGMGSIPGQGIKIPHTPHSFFIHSSVNGHLGYFHDLPVVNSAIMNIGIYIYFSFGFLRVKV